jgi:hypothetical protein
VGKQKKLAIEEDLSKQAASASELTKLAELHSNVISARDKINAPLSHLLAMLTLGLIDTLNLLPLLKVGIESAVKTYTGLWLRLSVNLEDKDNETWASNVVGVGTFILSLAALFFGIRAYFNGFFALSNTLFPNGFKQGLPVRHQSMEAIPNDISKFKTKAEIKHLTTVLEAKQKLLSGDLRFIYFWLAIIYAFGVSSNLSKIIKPEYSRSLSADGATMTYRITGVALTGESTRIFHDKLFGGAIPSLIGANLIEKWRNRSARKTNAKQLTQLEQLNIGQQAWTLVNADNPQRASFNLAVTESVSLSLSSKQTKLSPAVVIEELSFALNNTPWCTTQFDDKGVSVKGVAALKPSWQDWLYWQRPVDQINKGLEKQFEAREAIQKSFLTKCDELRGLLYPHTVYPVFDRIDNIKTVKFFVPASTDKAGKILNLLKRLYGDENVALADYSDGHIVVSGVNLAEKKTYQKALAKKRLADQAITNEKMPAPVANDGAEEVRKQQNIKSRRRPNQDSQPSEKTAKISVPAKASFKISWPGGYVYDSDKDEEAVFPITVPWAPVNTYFGVIKPGVQRVFFGGNGQPQMDMWEQLREIARRGAVVLNDPNSKAGGVGTVFEKTIQDGERYDVVVKNALNMGLFGKIYPQRGDNGRAVLVEYDYIGFRH